MIFHQNWLHSAAPAIAEGPIGAELPEGDLVWKHLQIRGMRLITATLYLDHDMGLTGINLDKVSKVAQLTDEGRRYLIVAADFSMEPEEWENPIVETMGLAIVTVGTDKTCRTAGGYRQLGYLLVSTDLVPFLDDIKAD